MKVVFDIPEDEYNYIKNCYPDGEDGERYAYMIKRSGAPLEKVLEDIKAEITNERDNKGFCVWYYDDLMEKIDKHISGKEQ